jgi:hypothetical protein
MADFSLTRYLLKAFCLLLAMYAGPLQARDKADTIYFKNGDRWTCEIQKLDRAYLYVKLDYVDGTVSVDWSKVDRVDSAQLFIVRTASGDLLTGPLATLSTPGEAREIAIGKGHSLPLSQVVSIEQSAATFWEGLHGGIDGGMNYAKSDAQTQYSLNTNASYRRELWEATATFQSSFNGSESGPNNFREDLSLNALRFLGRTRNTYFAAAIADVQHNDEQQLQLRTTLGGALGHLIKEGENSRAYWLAGSVWTRELYFSNGTSPIPNTNSAEGLAGIAFEYFRFKTTDFLFNMNVFPSFTDPGRVRLNGNVSVKFQLIKDLYWRFGTYLNYDSRPPENVTTKSDYGVSSSLGWSY